MSLSSLFPSNNPTFQYTLQCASIKTTSPSLLSNPVQGAVQAGAIAAISSGGAEVAVVWGSVSGRLGAPLSGGMLYEAGLPGAGCEGFVVPVKGVYQCGFTSDYTNAAPLTSTSVIQFALNANGSLNPLHSISASDFLGSNVIKATRTSLVNIELDAGDFVGVSALYNVNGGSGASPLAFAASNFTDFTCLLLYQLP